MREPHTGARREMWHSQGDGFDACLALTPQPPLPPNPDAGLGIHAADIGETMTTSTLRAAAFGAVVLSSVPALAEDYILKTRPQVAALRSAAPASAPLPAGRPLVRRSAAPMARSLQSTAHPFDAYRVVSVNDAATLAQLRAHPSVEWMELDSVGEGGDLPSDTYVDEQWPLRNTGQNGGTVGADIRAEAGWAVTTGSADVVVAVLDTGIQFDHPEFQGRLVPGYDFVNNDEDPAADHPHGVLASGILLANANNDFGVAGIDHRARLMPLKVLDANNRGSTSNLSSALIYAADNGVDVVSMSLINYSCGSSTLGDALQYARDAGVVLVSSAGNGGVGNADVSAPGCYEEVISVGATTRTDVRAGFSATGQALDLVAPGSSVPTAVFGSTGDEWTNFGGTSAAAPHVAGVASLMLALDDTLTHDDIKAILESTADDQVGADTDLPGWDEEYGWGRLNMGAALGTLQQGDVDAYATGEVAVRSNTAGALSDTFDADGESYQLRERTQGSWFWRTVELEHRFEFDVRGGTSVSFELLARRDGGSSDDDFLFEFSSNGGSSWSPMFSVDSTSFTARSFTLPVGAAGSLLVRVTDSGVQSDNRETTLFIDQMFVRSLGSGDECDVAPTAVIETSVTTGPAPLTVRFTDRSTDDPTAWLWQFGDGGESTQQDASHTYEVPGTYTVSLTVTNDCGQDETVEQDLIVVQPACDAPVTDFTSDVVFGEAPLDVSFSDLSTGADEWLWDFGDGTTSTAINPVHTYTEPGRYDVSLVTTNECGSDERRVREYVQVIPVCGPPTAAFDADVRSGDAPLRVRFTDRTAEEIETWFWEFGDGSTSTEQHPEHIYTEAGTYSVALTVVDACGEDRTVRTDFVVVDDPPAGTVVHVASLQVGSESNWWRQRGVATVRIVDQIGAPVEGATVTLVSAGPVNQSLSATTDANGFATVRTGWTWSSGRFCFEVESVVAPGMLYDASANVIDSACE